MYDKVSIINQALESQNCLTIRKEDTISENEFLQSWDEDDRQAPGHLEIQVTQEELDALVRQIHTMLSESSQTADTNSDENGDSEDAYTPDVTYIPDPDSEEGIGQGDAEEDSDDEDEEDTEDSRKKQYLALIQKYISAETPLSTVEIKAQVEAIKDKESIVPTRRWSFPKNRSKLETQFLNAYHEFVKTGCIRELRVQQDGSISTGIMREPLGYLLDLLGQLYTYRIFLRIRNLSVYIWGEEEDLAQQGHASATKAILRDVEAGEPYMVIQARKNPRLLAGLLPKNAAQTHTPEELEALTEAACNKLILRYFATIYKNKTRDYLRTYGLLPLKEKSKSVTQESVPGSQNAPGEKSVDDLVDELEEKEETPEEETDFDNEIDVDDEGDDSASSKKAAPQGNKKAPRKRYGYTAPDIRNTEKLDAITVSRDGDDLSDRFPELSSRSAEEELNEDKKLHMEIISLYLESLMHHKNVPGAPLTVMYSRCLFLSERLWDPNTAEQYLKKLMPPKGYTHANLGKAGQKVYTFSKTSSVKWARARMGDMTVRKLVAESQQVVQNFFGNRKNLCWGERMMNKLDEKYLPPHHFLWGEVIYTAYFNERQMHHWATETHNSTILHTARKIIAQPALLDHVDEYMDKKSKFWESIQTAQAEQARKLQKEQAKALCAKKKSLRTEKERTS